MNNDDDNLYAAHTHTHTEYFHHLIDWKWREKYWKSYKKWKAKETNWTIIKNHPEKKRVLDYWDNKQTKSKKEPTKKSTESELFFNNDEKQ